MNPKTMVLLENATSSQTSESFQWAGTSKGSIQLAGVWDGATVTMEGSLDGGLTWGTVTNGINTSDKLEDFGGGYGLVRAVLSDAGAGTNLKVMLTPPERN